MAQPIVKSKQFANIDEYIAGKIADAKANMPFEQVGIVCGAYYECMGKLLASVSVSEAVDALKREDDQMFEWLLANPQSGAYASVNLRRNAFADVLNFVGCCI